MGTPRRRPPSVDVEELSPPPPIEGGAGGADEEPNLPGPGVRRARRAVASAPIVREVDPDHREPQPRRAASPRGTNGKPSEPTGAPERVYARGRELASLLFVAAAAFLTLAIASYDERGGADWVGPVGARVAAVAIVAVGLVAWAIPLELALFAIPFLRGRQSVITLARLAGDVVLGATGAALVHVGAAGRPIFGGHAAGGVVGELFGELLRSLFSTIGTVLVGLTTVGLVLIARATFSFIELANRATETSAAAASRAAASVRGVAQAWQQARELERAGGVEPTLVRACKEGAGEGGEGPDSCPADDQSGVHDRSELRLRDDGVVPPEAHAIARQLAGAEPVVIAHGRTIPTIPMIPMIEGGDEQDPLTLATLSRLPAIPPVVVPTSEKPARRKRTRGDAEPTIAPPSPEAAMQRTDETGETDPLPHARDEQLVLPLLPPDEEDFEWVELSDLIDGDDGASSDERGALDDRKKRADPTDATKPARARKIAGRRIKAAFELPRSDLLEPPPSDQIPVDRNALLEEAKALVATLATYKVIGEVREIHPGPVVTTFELEPRIGTKVREVEGLANDLRLSLAKESVRIVAPIPGKNRIGFELPNAHRLAVNFRELIEDRRFAEAKGALPMVLGRDIVGAPVYEDLATMPHLLVAGATGAGKSVALNVMLASLLYRRTPDDLRMIMIDPKVVELAPFDRIPHMLLPVVTDMKQALNTLKWCVDEMERRYQLLAQAGVKNILTYHAWRGRVMRGEAPNPCPRTVMATDHNGLPEEIVARDRDDGEQRFPERLPYLVVVVDEFADLMMSVGKGEVEPPIARLAQKARAAGIHVVLATQRPSVDVITGMIKANFPTRIAFRVAQRVDSRTILDSQGAEFLLGRGDMLASVNGKSGLKRIQCPFVSEEEVQRICDFLRTQGEPVYDESIRAPRDDDGDLDEEDQGLSPKDQELYDRCVEIVREARKCSTSWLQRKMGLGYNKAARFVDRMEWTGVVGPAVGAGKDRDVVGR